MARTYFERGTRVMIKIVPGVRLMGRFGTIPRGVDPNLYLGHPTSRQWDSVRVIVDALNLPTWAPRDEGIGWDCPSNREQEIWINPDILITETDALKAGRWTYGFNERVRICDDVEIIHPCTGLDVAGRSGVVMTKPVFPCGEIVVQLDQDDRDRDRNEIQSISVMHRNVRGESHDRT